MLDQSPPTNVHTARHMEMVSLKVIITDREFLRSTKYIQLETNKNKMHTKCRDGRHECNSNEVVGLLGTERRLPRLECTPMQRLRLGVLAAFFGEHNREVVGVGGGVGCSALDLTPH